MLDKIRQTRPITFLKASAFLCSTPVLLIFITARHASNVPLPAAENITATSQAFDNTSAESMLSYRRQSCACTRPLTQQRPDRLVIDETASSLCSQYATLRGFHQRVISISMYGPRDNSLFVKNNTIYFLNELISDMTKIYPGWILRIYHDTTIENELICSVECAYHHVDFCNITSLGSLGNLSSYVPSKVWRFLPVGDPLVDVMASRDLDSPLTPRERAAVDQWLTSNKAWHVMRDHPMHLIKMLGGMWGFQSAMNRTCGNYLLQKMLDRSLISKYPGKGDQGFLVDHVWPLIKNDVIAHDSYHCARDFGKNSLPWPTRRPTLSEDFNCYVGCPRPCCKESIYPFYECPLACRPSNHTDWTMC